MTCGLTALGRFAITVALTALTLVVGVAGERAPVAHAASYVVNTLADSGPGSLRQAILDANAAAGADTITFSVSGTIVLASSLPAITDAAGLVIDGSGQAMVVSGNNTVRPFSISAGAAAELQNLLITNGFAPQGGGIENLGTLILIRSTVTQNRAVGGVFFGAGGGGIYNSGTAGVLESTINDNQASDTCGGFRCNGGSGGGVLNAGFMAIANSTISGNSANSGGFFGSGSGGGILSGGPGGMTITNTTVSGNAANGTTFFPPSGGFGGGIVSSAGTSLSNTVFAHNTSTQGGPDCSGSLSTTGPNLIGEPSGCTITGTPPLSGDAKVGPLADNGGPTKTHALLGGSPAIDAGDDAVCAAAPVSGKDQRGVSRPQGAHCDLGAFELEASVPVVGGKNLRITTGSIDLSWDGGTAQTGYTLLQYNANTSTATLINLVGTATSYSHAAAVPGALYCYALAAKGAGDVVLGLSDLECAMSGLELGTAIPNDFALKLGGTSNATMAWAAPVGGADSYLLARIPLDGTPATHIPLPSGTTTSTQAVTTAGTCFQLIAFKGGSLGTSDVLCGIPGFSTLGRPAGEKLQTVGEALAAVERGLASVAQAAASFGRLPE